MALGLPIRADARSTSPVTSGVILSGVTIVDTSSGKLTPNMAVVVEGNRIVRIARTGSVRTRGRARVVDARGKFVMPGFLDMHAHPLDSPDPVGSLTLMLANGVTGFRQMSGSAALLQARRDGALPLSDTTPALLIMPGAVLTPGNAATPAAIIAEIGRQKAQGADFIKVVAATPPTFLAGLSEAKRQGLPFVGHLPPSTSVVTASQGGMRAIEHEGPTESILLSCSSDEVALRRDLVPPQMPGPPSGMPQGSGTAPTRPPGPPMTLRSLVNPMAMTTAAGFAHIERTVASYDETRCRSVARTLAANGTWQVPTLLRVRTMEFSDDARYRIDPNLRYVPAAGRRLWSEVAGEFAARQTPESRATVERLFARQLRLAKLFEEAGVPMLAGTDFGGGWVIAGFGLHQEFDLLAKAGLSPLTVLQMTTLNGARFLGREATMGSVAVGKEANLVLLDANPVESVQALHRIAGVIRAGRYYAPADLDQMKKSVATRYEQALP
ncbi:amidohydrolase family protein [uncultured Sphingomonas sp.]|uniref:amidohydrolase family protein n=1 Tax=uncultured Sphingomonas sp. TaxID=158754 RepID=UPI0035C9F137